MSDELKQLRDANAKLAAANRASEAKFKKEIEKAKSERDRSLMSQKRSLLFDVRYWKDAHVTAVERFLPSPITKFVLFLNPLRYSYSYTPYNFFGAAGAKTGTPACGVLWSTAN